MDWDRETAILRRAAALGLIQWDGEEERDRLLRQAPLPGTPGTTGADEGDRVWSSQPGPTGSESAGADRRWAPLSQHGPLSGGESAAGSGRWGPRLSRLIFQGRLDERAVAGLAADLDRLPTRYAPSSPSSAPSPLSLSSLRGGFAAAAPAVPTARSVSFSSLSRNLAQSHSSWPVEGWDRFELVAFLGEGGMGRVYKAYDRRLGRYVAVKFLRGDDPDHAQRFLHEAQAQARVEHEHVCKIYEVGEVQGRLYIAMQYLAGETLMEAGPKMSLDERVEVMRQVCEGIHAAHRLGLVHRDIKPVNILVEREESEARAGTRAPDRAIWRPYVLDFGLARELEAPGLTQTGFIIGTPAYLAPEQARGGHAGLDSRTDVHALGATLYCLLVGRSPYDGGSALEILQKVLASDPEPPRRIDPSLPADLETIVMKCLEKDPARRYDSARALAEDLGRFLDGEPIAARPPSLTYRLAKKTRKHRAVVAAGGVAAAAILVFAGLALRTELRSREQTRLASIFGQEVQYVDELTRRAYGAPLHDIRAEKQEVRERLRALQAQVAQAGDAGEGPGHYALGRGLLTLGESEPARAELKRAWDGGYRVPEVAYALGRALGDLYNQKLEEAERLETGAELVDLEHDLALAYRDPAHEYLQASQGVRVDSPDYVQALIAFYDGRFEEAEARAEAAFQKVPWLYEAPLLEGEIWVTRAEESRDHGDDAATDNAYRRAEAAYRKAAAIGQSDPRTYEGLAHYGLSRMEWLFRSWQDLRPSFEAVKTACAQALAIEPDRIDALRRLSNAGKAWATDLMRRNQSAGVNEALAEAARAAIEIIKLRPDSAGGYSSLGLVYLQQARYEARLGYDPLASFTAAVRSFEAALPANPNLAKLRQDLGNAYKEKAEADGNFGRDPTDAYDRAGAQYAKALELKPRSAEMLFVMGGFYLSRGQHQPRGADPTAWYEKAITAFQHSRDINPNDYRTDQNLGGANLEIARYRVDHGRDPGAALPSAILGFTRASKARPELRAPYIDLGNTHAVAARSEAERGADPRPAVERAAAFYRQALSANVANVASASGAASAGRDTAGRPGAADPLRVFAQTRLALLMAFAALYEAEHGRGASEALAQASSSSEQARELDPLYPVVWADAAEVEMARARCALLAGDSPREAFQSAAADLDRAFTLNRNYFPGFYQLAELDRRRAEWHLQGARAVARSRRASPATRAARAAARADIEQGLAAAGKSLAHDATDDRALAVQGVLELLAASGERDVARRTAAARRGREALTRALALNQALEREYKPYLDH
ncbi:MAG TPA: serine/threonine-protein kinase [Thermoanaerobaculia bacterium]|nr:serine/threonine-protein kinase [Thermoanaerobaculia bacterium]